MAEEYLSYSEAARQLNISEEELKRLVDAGEIRTFRDGPEVKFGQSDIAAYQRKKREKAQQKEDSDLMFLSDDSLKKEDTADLSATLELSDEDLLDESGEESSDTSIKVGDDSSEAAIEVSEAPETESLFEGEGFDISPLEHAETTTPPTVVAQPAEAEAEAEPYVEEAAEPVSSQILEGIEERGEEVSREKLKEADRFARRPAKMVSSSPVLTVVLFVCLILLLVAGVFLWDAATGYNGNFLVNAIANLFKPA